MQIFINALSGFATTAYLSLPTRKFIQTINSQEPIAQVTTDPILGKTKKTLCINAKRVDPEVRASTDAIYPPKTTMREYNRRINQARYDCQEPTLLNGTLKIYEWEAPPLPKKEASIPETLNTTSFELPNTQQTVGLTTAFQTDFTTTNETLKPKEAKKNIVTLTAKRAPSLKS